MKTLDEVIEAMSYCVSYGSECPECPFYSAPDCGVQDDALLCLKEYRSEKAIWEDYRKNLSDMVMKRAKAYKDAAKRLIEKYKELDIGTLNNPLTWDELAQMIGKPVWVEQRYQKMWGLNDGTYVDAFGNDCITIKVLHDLCHFEKKLMGITWQAYRKERE